MTRPGIHEDLRALEWIDMHVDEAEADGTHFVWSKTVKWDEKTLQSVCDVEWSWSMEGFVEVNDGLMSFAVEAEEEIELKVEAFNEWRALYTRTEGKFDKSV